MYGADEFLVDNSLDRYSLGDRINMTYPDGTLVYGGESSEDSAPSRSTCCCSLRISRCLLNGNRTDFPLPLRGQHSSFTCAGKYGPTDSLTDGTYKYHKLTAVASNPPLP
ncbi:hypothetical protein C8R43DRAFT_1036620 [Mycena crocata]|nr:hypothetical protein C8R43DRAFT_1036620 [Mycena crocata]